MSRADGAKLGPAGERSPPRFDVVTIFPELFVPFVATSIVGRAISRGLVSIGTHDPRDFTCDRHRTVDDYPYGGGGGMVMRAEPLGRCLDSIRGERAQTPHVIMLSARGELYGQALAGEISGFSWIVLVCGHYKGVDERVTRWVDREVSIGDYVLSGGEIPAMVVIDSIVRLLPGAVGDLRSAQEDSHFEVLLSAPEYTRPEVFEGMKVPPVLLSGDHEKIRRWRREQAVELTKARRPDLYRKYAESLGKQRHKRSTRDGIPGSGSRGPRVTEES